MFGKKKVKPKQLKREIKEKKRVMLVCGSGMVSSTLVYPMVEEILKEGGYRFEIIKGSFNDVKNHQNISIILTTVSPLPKEVLEMGIPISFVTPLFKGNKDAVKGDIYEKLG